MLMARMQYGDIECMWSELLPKPRAGENGVNDLVRMVHDRLRVESGALISVLIRWY